jgi:sec-independent protein translocase protein TatB
MSLPDTIFILLAALLLFGPKKLPEIARQVGKLMAELRRASNEFKFQMEDELRQADEAERRKKAEAAAAATSAAVASTTTTAAPTLPAPTPVTLELPSTGAPIANRVSPHAADLLPSEDHPATATTNAEPVTPDLAPPVLTPPVLTPKGDA